MHKIALFTLAAIIAPLGVSAATIAAEGGGPYDVTSDTLFTGIVTSSGDGAGSYILDFFTSGATQEAVANAAVTEATINSSFTDLSMSWIDGLALNTIVSAAGVDQLTTVFNGMYPVQQLRFDWTDSVNGAGFRFDVTTTIAAVPLPASALLLLTAFAGAGFAGRKRKTQTA
ncbi:VPLPA-CTERM sorting domain-containing protein [Primorskyibacter sp. 2E107]|uniref:VPLPA-CTERM sorting domain-containing protein n=1 Tax=Primorskyibacter sp. 2E107 TaxID=3403458 RepID=UPI003AF638CC